MVQFPSDTEPRGGIPGSYILAGIIFLAVVLYFATGTILSRNDEGEAETTAVERPLFTVLVQDSIVSARNVEVTIAGRTEAGKRVIVRAETPGQVVQIAKEGTRVEEGALLCRLDTDSRRAMVAEAQAAAAKADADFAGTERLFAEGFASDAALRTARAARDGARARLSQATIDLRNVDVRAPFAGQVATMVVDPGDVIGAGGACAELADLDDIVVAGGVAASQAAQIHVGDQAVVSIGADSAEPATVSFVADVADDQTRAFRVELELENAEGISVGLNARAVISAGAADAITVPRNALVFDDTGALGVRVLTNLSDGITGDVAFHPATVVSEGTTGVFITGVPAGAPVIIRGQEFVSAGTRVAYQTADGVVGD